MKSTLDPNSASLSAAYFWTGFPSDMLKLLTSCWCPSTHFPACLEGFIWKYYGMVFINNNGLLLKRCFLFLTCPLWFYFWLFFLLQHLWYSIICSIETFSSGRIEEQNNLLNFFFSMELSSMHKMYCIYIVDQWQYSVISYFCLKVVFGYTKTISKQWWITLHLEKLIRSWWIAEAGTKMAKGSKCLALPLCQQHHFWDKKHATYNRSLIPQTMNQKHEGWWCSDWTWYQSIKNESKSVMKTWASLTEHLSHLYALCSQ